MKHIKVIKVLSIGLIITVFASGCGGNNISVDTNNGVKVKVGDVKVDVGDDGIKVDTDNINVDVGDGVKVDVDDKVNVDVGAGVKTNVDDDVNKTDTNVKVDTGEFVKNRIPYTQLDDLGGLYQWADEEDKSLYHSYVTLEDHIDKKAYTYEDMKVKILSTCLSLPEVTDPKFGELAKALDEERARQKKNFDKIVKEALEWANEMVNSIDGLDKDNISVIPYEYEVSWTPIRNDEKLLTIVITKYSNFGGAHPNCEQEVLSFNPKTGEKLSLKSITIDEKSFRRAVEQKILDYISKNNRQEYLFDKEMTDEEFKKWDQDWWILNGYLFVGFNSYDIAPYAAGPIVFPVDITDLKDNLNEYGKSLLDHQ